MTCDPYPELEETAGAMRNAIERLHFYGVSARVLTKSGTRAVRDFDLLGSHPDDAFGATLSFLDEKQSRHWEPGAALPEERIAGLEEAHKRGIPTWINVAPVIDPEQALEVIRKTHKFCDLYWVAGMSAMSTPACLSEPLDWLEFADKVVSLCRELEVPCGVGYGDDSAKVLVAGETMTANAMWERIDSAMTEELWRQTCSEQRPHWELALRRPWTATRLRADFKVRCVRQWGLW
jgi:hypothetical protein